MLGGRELIRRIYSTRGDDRLVVTPLLDPKGQIQEASSSVDLRLGTQFLVPRRPKLAYIDPGKESAHGKRCSMHERVFVPLNGTFVLHPSQFVLGGTMEYLGLPSDLGGYVVGRSSWGRLGLILATAIGIHPGFKGAITLELTKVGEVPIYLRPGRAMGQVCFHKGDGTRCGGVDTPYIGAVGPELSRIGPDSDLATLHKIGLGERIPGRRRRPK